MFDYEQVAILVNRVCRTSNLTLRLPYNGDNIDHQQT
jgi:hypothetical protein